MSHTHHYYYYYHYHYHYYYYYYRIRAHWKEGSYTIRDVWYVMTSSTPLPR